MSNLERVLKVYNEQTKQIMGSFGPTYGTIYQNTSAPVMFGPYGYETDFLKHDTGVGIENELDLWGVEGGLFADCCIDNPIFSLLTRPFQGVASLIPVRADNNTLVKRAYLTGNYDLDGDRPDGVCEPGPNVGAMDACFAEFRKGRVSYSTRTAELDALLENACMGINLNRHYFINRNRGVSGPAPSFNSTMGDEIIASALRREMHMLGTRMNIDLMKQFWLGDTANNTANGGYVEFTGLLDQITDQYGTAATPWVTGTGDCTQLNSDVKAFDACIGATNADGFLIYDLMKEIQYELSQRARAYGAQVDWVIVMASPLWQSLVDSLPCEMMADGCNTADTGVQIVSNDNYQSSLRTQMRNSFTIAINGQNYPVLIDDFIPVVEAGAAPAVTYTSDIIFLPLRVNGQSTIEWVYKDYRGFNEVLAGLPSALTGELRGWSDDGKHHAVLQRDLRCFFLEVKSEFGITFSAPMLAGRINNVMSCQIQNHTVLNLID